jgi:hypothetical protein
MDNSADLFGPVDPAAVRVYDTNFDLTLDNSDAPLQDEDLLIAIAQSFFSDLAAPGAPGAPGTPCALATIFKN